MARPLRIEYEGAFYHVLNRGLEKRSIFLKRKDFEHFLKRCLEIHHQYQIRFHAYCLMPNHYHLFIETPKANLQKAMKHLNGAYAQYFNCSQKRVGPLFQGRYKALLVEKNSYFLELSRYIHLNPVKAKLSAHFKDYPHSSFRYFLDNANKPAFLETQLTLDFFSQNRASARKMFASFTLEGLKESFDPFKICRAGVVLGSNLFLERIREEFLEKRREDPEIPQIKEIKKASDCLKCQRQVESFDVSVPIKRKLLVYALRHYTSLTLKEIQIETALSSYHSASKIAQRTKKDESLNRWIQKIDNKMSNV